MRKVVAQDQEVGFRLNLGEYFRVLWRKKYFLIVPLLISVVVSNIGVRFLVPEYESSSVIRLGGSQVNTEVNRFVQTDSRRREAEFGAQLEADIQGNAFLDELIKHLGMDQDPHLIESANYERENLYPGISTEELVLRRLRNYLKRRINIDRAGPNMYRLAYADANPEKCYVVAEAITRLYIDMQHRQTMRGLKDVSQFSEEQLQVYKERLDRSERELANFQERLAAPSMATNPVNTSNIALAERISADLDLTINSADDALERIRTQVVTFLGEVPDGDRIFRDSEVRKLQNDLAMRRESELLGELSSSITAPGAGSSSADAIASTQQALQRRLGQLVGDQFSAVPLDYRPLVVEYFYQRVEVGALKNKRTRLDGYVRGFRSQVASAPELESELARLRQEVEHNRSVYNTFQSAQTTTQISEAAQDTELGASVFLVETATRPLAPVRPDRFKILVLAFLFGAAIGASGLLLTEFTDSSFRSVDEIEKQLGLKVLGTIPRFEKSKWFHDSARKRAVVWTATSVVFLAVALAGFYFYGKTAREQMIDLNLKPAVSSNTPKP